MCGCERGNDVSARDGQSMACTIIVYVKHDVVEMRDVERTVFSVLCEVCGVCGVFCALFVNCSLLFIIYVV